jgi:hypothetical protein
MSASLRWLAVPGASLLLVGVLSLDRGGDSEPGSAPLDAVARSPQLVMAREASGPREALPFGGLMQQAVILGLPAGCAGERATIKLFRVLSGRREPTPWIEARPNVRADGTLPMAGVVDGLYHVEVELDSGRRFVSERVRAPGEVTLAAAPAR